MDDFRGLKVSGLSKRFGYFQALEDVGFELRAGEVLGLIGPNGAGNSGDRQTGALKLEMQHGLCLESRAGKHLVL